MHNAELLERVKAMRPRERERFVLAVLQLEETTPVLRKRQPERVRWPDVAARAQRIFGSRVLPNLVLAEREESPV